MKTQNLFRYKKLTSRIAWTCLIMCGLMLVLGRMYTVSEYLAKTILGNKISVDIVYLAIECVVKVAMIILPLLIFNYMQRNAFVEKLMPVEKKILSKKNIPYVFILGLCALFFVGIININAYESVIRNMTLNYSGYGEDYMYYTGLRRAYQVFFYIVAGAVIPAVCEELVFRKAFCDALAPYGPKTAILVTSIVFAMMHTSFGRVLFTFAGGIFFGWLYIGTKNIKLPMLMHFVHNFMMCVMDVLAFKSLSKAYVAIRVLYFIILLGLGIFSLVKMLNYKSSERRRVLREAYDRGEYEAYLLYQQQYARRLEMMPDENGEEVKPLTKGQKVGGFFSVGMIIFIALIYVQMSYNLALDMGMLR